MNAPLSKMLPWMAGGVGLSLLENKLLGNNLPGPIKTVNVGLGAGTGALMADPATRAGAISSLPFKQLGLIGVGSMDRFRRAQQGLVDTNLQTAKTNLNTAHIQGRDAGGRKALLAAALLPAFAVGGAAAYGAYDKYKKNHRPSNRFSTVNSSGKPPAHQKVRIDVPPSALPKDFFTSFAGLAQNPKAYSRLEEQPGEDGPPVNRMRKKRARLHPNSPAEMYKRAAQQDKPGWMSTLGNLGYEMTGIPSFGRALSDAGHGYINMEQGNHGEAMRYGLGAVGGALAGYTGLRMGALPILGKMIGKARLGGVLSREGGGLARQLGELPTFARPIFRDTFGNELNPRTTGSGVFQSAAERLAKRKAMLPDLNARRLSEGQSPLPSSWATTGPLDRARNQAFRYDPNHLAWDNPNSPWWSPSSPASRSSPPPQFLPGQLMNVGKYGLNRGMNAAYYGKQFARRWPMLSMTAASVPLAGMGVLSDKSKMDDARDSLEGSVPDYARNQGPYGMPISSALSGLLQSAGGPNVSQGISEQMQGTRHNPYNWGRMAGMVL